MDESKRAKAREIAQRHLSAGDALGWFEDLYSQAQGDPSVISWADLAPNPNLVAWLDAHKANRRGKTALKIGCGLGDDAEELARRGFETTAFDISPTAISWCKKRFPDSPVSYLAHDLFSAPRQWNKHFDFVLESYTLQVIPSSLRKEAIAVISGFIRPGGKLLVIARGRDSNGDEGKMPWPLVRSEFEEFQRYGLGEVTFEDYEDREDPPVRRFRALYINERLPDQPK